MSIVFEHKTEVENTIEEAFAWHERKGAFRRLMPPWELAEEVRARRVRGARGCFARPKHVRSCGDVSLA